MPPTRALVIGIGNAARGDDAAGLLVARRVGALGLPGVVALTEQREGAALITAWQRFAAPRVFLVDAAVSGAPPGSIRRLALAESALPLPGDAASTHRLGVAQAVALARVLGCLPPSLVLYTIEAAQFGLEQALTPEVAQAVGEAARRIACEIEAAAG